MADGWSIPVEFCGGGPLDGMKRTLSRPEWTPEPVTVTWYGYDGHTFRYDLEPGGKLRLSQHTVPHYVRDMQSDNPHPFAPLPEVGAQLQAMCDWYATPWWRRVWNALTGKESAVTRDTAKPSS